jgi:hypothetical protein
MISDLAALFDMDGTLFDYEGSLKLELAKIRAPNEQEIPFNFNNNPAYIENRIKLITGFESFWSEMPKFQLGWDVLEIAREMEYQINILTQGPKNNPSAWSGKKKCIDQHFGEDCNLTLTRNKGLVYGKILVDDYPGYIAPWLKWRKNGLVIMPANSFNEGYSHPQVIRYDGKNLEEVRNAMQKIKDDNSKSQ